MCVCWYDSVDVPYTCGVCGSSMHVPANSALEILIENMQLNLYSCHSLTLKDVLTGYGNALSYKCCGWKCQLRE